MNRRSSNLPDLDDDVETLIDKNLGAFKDKVAKMGEEMGKKGEEKKLSRDELLQKMKQKRMFFEGRRLTKVAQSVKLDDVKKKYAEQMKQDAEDEQAKVVGSNLEKNRRKRERKNAKRKQILTQLKEKGVGNGIGEEVGEEVGNLMS